MPIGSMSSRESCPVCRSNASHQRYFLEIDTAAGRHVIDKKKAANIVLGRVSGPHPIPAEKLRELVSIRKEWVKDHLWHVNPSRPGIIGRLFGGIFLVDGLYRARRCLKENTSFRAYILTFDETIDCLVDGPAVTPEWAIAEIREMLERNQGIIPVDLPLRGELIGDNTPLQMEKLIRSSLSEEENRRISLVFHYKGRAIVEEPGEHKTQKPE